jgi:hypothetical protein
MSVRRVSAIGAMAAVIGLVWTSAAGQWLAADASDRAGGVEGIVADDRDRRR